MICLVRSHTHICMYWTRWSRAYLCLVNHFLLTSARPPTAEWTCSLMCGGGSYGFLQVWPGKTWRGWPTLTDRFPGTFLQLCPSRWGLWLCASCLKGKTHLFPLCSIEQMIRVWIICRLLRLWQFWKNIFLLQWVLHPLFCESTSAPPRRRLRLFLWLWDSGRHCFCIYSLSGSQVCRPTHWQMFGGEE